MWHGHRMASSFLVMLRFVPLVKAIRVDLPNTLQQTLKGLKLAGIAFRLPAGVQSLPKYHAALAHWLLEQHACLYECQLLVKLPDSFCDLRCLQSLRLSSCSNSEVLQAAQSAEAGGIAFRISQQARVSCCSLLKLPNYSGNTSNSLQQLSFE